jgi:hypothetical protein
LAARFDSFFNCAFDFVQINAEIAENLHRKPFAVADQTQKKMLRPDMIVAETQSLFPGKLNGHLNSAGEVVSHFIVALSE